MKNLMYTIGITAFLVCGIFNVTATLKSPFFGMSHIALAQGSGGSDSGIGFGKQTLVCTCYDDNGWYCRTATKCTIGYGSCSIEQGCFNVCPGCPGF